MKILLDLQPLQSESRFHGIGRVTEEISKRLIPALKQNDLVPSIFLTDLYAKEGMRLRKLYPDVKFEILNVDGFKDYFSSSEEDWYIYELILEWKISEISPDVYLSFSFFYFDQLTSIGKLRSKTKNFVIAHDVIPYLFPEYYLQNPIYKKWYLRKLEEFKKADLFFSNSESTKKDLVHHLKIDPKKVIVIPLGCNEIFRPLREDEKSDAERELRKLGIDEKYVLYVPSGYDPRKNLEILIKAYALLPEKIRKEYKLVIASKVDENSQIRLKNYADKLEVKDRIIFTGHVSDEALFFAYNSCGLFVYPSLYEGFGLPVLEAMKCGVPVIASDSSSIKEIVGLRDALFDPKDPEEIASKMIEGLQNEKYRSLLKENSLKQSARYSYAKAVEIILNTILSYA